MEILDMYKALLASSYDSYLSYLKATQRLRDMQENAHRSNGIVMINEDRFKDLVDEFSQTQVEFGKTLGSQVKHGFPADSELSVDDVDKMYRHPETQAVEEPVASQAVLPEDMPAPDNGAFESALDANTDLTSASPASDSLGFDEFYPGSEDDVNQNVQDEAMNDLAGLPQDAYSDFADSPSSDFDDSVLDSNDEDEEDSSSVREPDDDSSKSEDEPLEITTDETVDPSGEKRSNQEVEDNSKDYEVEKEAADKEQAESSEENQKKASDLVSSSLDSQIKTRLGSTEKSNNPEAGASEAIGIHKEDPGTESDDESSDETSNLDAALAGGVDENDLNDLADDENDSSASATDDSDSLLPFNGSSDDSDTDLDDDFEDDDADDSDEFGLDDLDDDLDEDDYDD